MFIDVDLIDNVNIDMKMKNYSTMSRQAGNFRSSYLSPLLKDKILDQYS